MKLLYGYNFFFIPERVCEENVMTLQQLKYAVEIEKCGSLSKAAKKLFVSQPNLSNAVKELETEYGFSIFKRNNRGVQVTDKGLAFLNYARSVLHQCDEMKNISTETTSSSFRVIAQNYSPIMESFVKFVKQNSNIERMNYELMNAQGFEVVDKVYKQEADLGIFIIMEKEFNTFEDHLRDRNLEFIQLGRLSFYVNLRNEHPALEYRDNIFVELHKYPVVLYRESVYEQSGDSFLIDPFNFINKDKTIYVFDRDVKFKLVSETDAFGIGTKLHPNFSKHYKWVRIPIPDVYAKIGYIHRANQPLKTEAQSYITLLKHELEGLIL